MPEYYDIDTYLDDDIVSKRRRSRRVIGATVLSAALAASLFLLPLSEMNDVLPVSGDDTAASTDAGEAYSSIPQSVETQASSPAKTALESAGIKTAMVVPIEEKTIPEQGNYCIPFFPENEVGDIVADGKDIVLAMVDGQGAVSFDSFARAVASLPGHEEIEADLAKKQEAEDLDGICSVIADITGYAVPCYAAIDSGYATELRNGITEVEPKTIIRNNISPDRKNEATDAKTVVDDSLWYNQNDYNGYY